MKTSLEEISLEESTYLLHHVFLPPKLPQSDDYNPKYEISLLKRVISAFHEFRSLVPDEDSDILTPVTSAMSRLRDVCEDDGSINEAKLEKSFEFLNHQGENDKLQVNLLHCILLASRWPAPYLCP